MQSARVIAAFAVVLFGLSLSGCDQGDPVSRRLAAHGPFSEAWEVDTQARLSFPPVGLEDFAIDIEHSASLRVSLHLGADGRLHEATADQVQDLSADEVTKILDAFRKARYEPAHAKGAPVASIKRIALSFDPNARFTADTTAPMSSRR